MITICYTETNQAPYCIVSVTMDSKTPSTKPFFLASSHNDPIMEFVSPIIHVHNHSYQSIGTVTIIRPGLGITSKHVILHHLAEHGINSNASIHKVPFQLLTYQIKGRHEYTSWYVTSFFLSQHTDIAFLILAPGNKDGVKTIDSSSATKIIKLDLYPPSIGSRVFGFGYPETKFMPTHTPTIKIEPHTTSGIVEEVYMTMRDKVMLPFPVFRVNARFSGGMSGGPLFNETGSLVGIITAGIDTEPTADEHFISHGALLWPTMSTRIILNRVDYPDMNERPYPILELARDMHIYAKGWEDVSIATEGQEETITFRKHRNR